MYALNLRKLLYFLGNDMLKNMPGKPTGFLMICGLSSPPLWRRLTGDISRVPLYHTRPLHAIRLHAFFHFRHIAQKFCQFKAILL